MIERYNTPELRFIWSDENKINIWKNVSAQYVYNLSKHDFNVEDLINIIITPYEISEHERITKHEFLAFIELFTKKAPIYLKKYIHYGLTSSDILDTSYSIQLSQALEKIIDNLKTFILTLKNKAIEHKDTMMMGRTHGMYAEPISFGHIILTFYHEFNRALKRLEIVAENINYGQLSGPVGNYVLCSHDIEQKTLKDLNLKVEPTSTQVIPRDRYAELFCSLAILASSMERIATEIRQLSQSSVGEVAEGFAVHQKGSSAMPHKKNPIGSENICGLSRLIRSYALPALENITLWHERDMSHSSNERLIGQDATSLTFYCLNRLNEIVKNLIVNKDKMQENIKNSKYLFYSQRLLLMLVEKGYNRDEAYKIVQDIAFKTQQSTHTFQEVFNQHDIKIKLNCNEKELFDFDFYTKHNDIFFKNIKE
jgi:adenylosuccinate lyase